MQTGQAFSFWLATGLMLTTACRPVPIDSSSEVLPAPPRLAVNASAPPASYPPQVARMMQSCRRQVEVTRIYDPSYQSLAYPNGDVDGGRGVCADVVVRAFRAVPVDLQQRVHEDMQAHFDAYPRLWSLRRPDPNIDHRRVANLQTYFARMGKTVAHSQSEDFLPGDVVAWRLGGNAGRLHIGVVSDVPGPTGAGLVFHNIGAGTQLEDVLFAWHIIGHYRYFPAKSPAP